MAGGALIAKAILGSIGGGFEGAAKPYTSGNTGVKGADMKVNLKSKNKEIELDGDSLKNENLTDKEKSESLNSMNTQKAPEAFKQKADTSKPFGGFANFNFKNGQSVLSSDEGLKNIYGDSLSDKLIENFAKIDAIDFTYTPEAQEEYKGENAVDDKEHVGVKAQELADNPATEGAVEVDEKGNLEIDTNHLTAANTATIAELSRRVLTLETALKDLTDLLKNKEL